MTPEELKNELELLKKENAQLREDFNKLNFSASIPYAVEQALKARGFLMNPIKVVVRTNDVSDPPTDAQLDTAFGSPGDLGEGFIGILNDNGAETTVWLCIAVGTGTWFYEGLTKAV